MIDKKNVKLVIPNEQYLFGYLEACREYKANGDWMFNVHNPDTFEDWKTSLFSTYENYRLGLNLPDGYVPASAFWLVENNMFIGAGNIRHRLTPALERFGGHIGYFIRPSKWNQGYGTVQLALLLKEAWKLGIDRALVTCDEDNVGSYRVMEKNGGIYRDTIENFIDGKVRCTKRYWFDTSL